jgi:glycosyltransferase involved in cell wall biosynthesis
VPGSQDKPFVSVIIPCRDEEKFIAQCLESVMANDYPKDRLEVLVIDGISEDGTRAIVEGYVKCYSFVRLFENPKKIAPTALNIGIAHAKGEIIMRMDAHNIYPTNYISGLVAWLEKRGADNVGGIWKIRPANDSPIAKAIAIGLSHPFGVGNAYYRIGLPEPRWVDTVPFGCYWRKVFDRLGLFDEELVRNQDDEFNHRLIKSGGRILLVPEVFSYYYARDSLRKLWNMYYQYGYFKPLVALKVGKVMTVRQLIPALFVLGLLGSTALAVWSWSGGLILLALVIAYTAAALSCSAVVAFTRGVMCALGLSLVFPTLHLSYGLGFLKGILDFVILRPFRAGSVARGSVQKG